MDLRQELLNEPQKSDLIRDLITLLAWRRDGLIAPGIGQKRWDAGVEADLRSGLCLDGLTFQLVALAIDPGTKHIGLAHVYRFQLSCGQHLYHIDVLPCIKLGDSEEKNLKESISTLGEHVSIIPNFHVLIGHTRDKGLRVGFVDAFQRQITACLSAFDGFDPNNLTIHMIDESGSSEIARQILVNLADKLHPNEQSKTKRSNLKSIAMQAGLDDSLAAAIIAARWIFNEEPEEEKVMFCLTINKLTFWSLAGRSSSLQRINCKNEVVKDSFPLGV